MATKDAMGIYFVSSDFLAKSFMDFSWKVKQLTDENFLCLKEKERLKNLSGDLNMFAKEYQSFLGGICKTSKAQSLNSSPMPRDADEENNISSSKTDGIFKLGMICDLFSPET